MEITFSEEVVKRFSGLRVCILEVNNLKIERISEELESFKKEVIKGIKDRYSLDSLKDDVLFRKYRDFFWKIGIDPTKIRPASEALVRRILQNKPLPKINTGVDSYNLASIEEGVPLAAFDADKLFGNLNMRFANEGEAFLGIGMKEKKFLKGKEVVVNDNRGIIAVYPYRDADFSKITENTKNIVLMSCGVPGVSEEMVKGAGELAKSYLEMFCR